MVLRQTECTPGDRVAHLLGLSDQTGRAGWQRSSIRPRIAQLVVVIGALQRRDFVVHKRFQFWRRAPERVHRRRPWRRPRGELAWPHRYDESRPRSIPGSLSTAWRLPSLERAMMRNSCARRDHVREHIKQQHRQRDAGSERQHARMDTLGCDRFRSVPK